MSEQYKQKWVRRFFDYDRFIKSAIEDINEAELILKDNQKKIEALDKSIEVLTYDVANSHAIEFLEKAKLTITNECVNCSNVLVKRNNKLAEYRAAIKILQEVCPHEDTEYDHTSSHNNEDFHKCRLCGLVI